MLKMEQTVFHHVFNDIPITLALFKDVGNASELKQDVMNGVFQATLLKTPMIVDPFQVLVAANKAVYQWKMEKMTTRNQHSEVLFCLSPNKNIGSSFQQFGIGDSDTSLFVVIIDDKDGETLKLLQSKVKGTQIPIADVSNLADVDSVKKMYQVKEPELSSCTLLDSIVSRIASKGL